jgi:hypothetical protein
VNPACEAESQPFGGHSNSARFPLGQRLGQRPCGKPRVNSFAEQANLCGVSLRAEFLPRDAGRILLFSHVTENAARGVCAELVQVAPVIEGSPALYNLSLPTLALGAFLRFGPFGPDVLMDHTF